MPPKIMDDILFVGGIIVVSAMVCGFLGAGIALDLGKYKSYGVRGCVSTGVFFILLLTLYGFELFDLENPLFFSEMLVSYVFIIYICWCAFWFIFASRNEPKIQPVKFIDAPDSATSGK